MLTRASFVWMSKALISQFFGSAFAFVVLVFSFFLVSSTPLFFLSNPLLLISKRYLKLKA